MRLLNETEVQDFCRMLTVDQSVPVRTSQILRNAQCRVYNIAGRYFALEIALPSQWVNEIVEIREEDIPKFTK